MMIDVVDLVGMAATVLSLLILFPDMVNQYRTKSKGKISIRMLTQVMLVNILWVTYGGLTIDYYVAGRAVIGLLISGLSVYFYLKYSGQAIKGLVV